MSDEFDEIMRAAFPPIPLPDDHIRRMESMSKKDRAINRALIDIDDILCDLRDRVAEMRANLGDHDE